MKIEGSGQWPENQRKLLEDTDRKSNKEKNKGSKSVAGEIEIEDQENQNLGGYFLEDLDNANKRKKAKSPRSVNNNFNLAESDENDSFGDIPED